MHFLRCLIPHLNSPMRYSAIIFSNIHIPTCMHSRIHTHTHTYSLSHTHTPTLSHTHTHRQLWQEKARERQRESSGTAIASVISFSLFQGLLQLYSFKRQDINLLLFVRLLGKNGIEEIQLIALHSLLDRFKSKRRRSI